MSLTSMLTGLEQAGVRFVVAGGLAEVAHGSPYVTDRLDICYDPASNNLELLASLLASWGAYPRSVPPGLPFKMDARTLQNSPVLTLRTREGDIDVFGQVEGIGGYERCAASSSRVALPPIRFRVLNLDALIAARRAAGRRRDREYILTLEALRELKQIGSE